MIEPTPFSDIDIKAAEVLYAFGYRYIAREDNNLIAYANKPIFKYGMWMPKAGKHRAFIHIQSLFAPLSPSSKEPLSIAALLGKEEDNK